MHIEVSVHGVFVLMCSMLFKMRSFVASNLKSYFTWLNRAGMGRVYCTWYRQCIVLSMHCTIDVMYISSFSLTFANALYTKYAMRWGRDQLVAAQVCCFLALAFQCISQTPINIGRMLIIYDLYFHACHTLRRWRRAHLSESILNLSPSILSTCNTKRNGLFVVVVFFFTRITNNRHNHSKYVLVNRRVHLGLFLDCYGISFWFNKN